MAKKGSGGTGGTQLASGYISLSVKYASAMGQIADDFDAIDKRSKAVGESLTKNLVAGADSAKAKVAELGSAYELQRAKVAALKDTLAQLKAQQDRAAAADKAYNEAFRADKERRKAYIQEEIRLNEALNQARAKARSSGVAKEEIDNSAGVKAVQAQIEANNAKRKADLQTLTRMEKELAAARSAAGTDGSKVQEALNAELAKGKSMFDLYGKAVEDATRKQQLASTSAAALSNSMGSAAQHISFGQRMARMIAGPFAPELASAGTKAGNAFRRMFSHQMDGAKQESQHHARSLANGLLMGMTPGVLGAAGVGLAFGKAFSMGFERNEVIETTKLRLQALGKTSQEISAVTDTALKSVQGTQYSLAVAIDAASNAMLSGIKLGPEMTQYMDNIANAAALTGVEYDTVADAMGRVQRQGTVSLENIEPLTNKGLPVLDWLAEYYKKDFPNTTKTDITEMISKKLIPADVLQKVMSAHLNNSMKDIGKKTVKGAFTDLMTQVGKVTGSILEPVMGEGGIPAFLNRIGARLNTFSQYIRPGVAAFVTWIRKQWTVVSDVFGKVIEWVQDRWAAMWPTMKVWIDKFTAMWREMWPQLIAHVQPLLAAFRRLWDALWPIVKPLVGLAGLIAYEFIKHMPAIAQFATNLVNWLATALEWLRTKFWPWLKVEWKHFVDDVKTGWEAVKTFSDKVIGFFDAIKTGTEKTWTWLEDKFKWMKDNIPGLTTLLNAFGLGGGGGSGGVALMNSSSPLSAADVGGVNKGMQVGTIGVKNALQSDLGISIGGGYRKPDGYDEHSGGNAFDVMVKSTAEGDRVAADALKKPGVDFVLWKQRTWHPDGTSTPMPDRGNPTANHMDHVHVHVRSSGYAAGAGPNDTGLPRGSNAASYPTAPVSSPGVSLTSGSVNPLWDSIAAKESSGRWNDNNSGNNSTSSGAPRGGLQITDGTWKAFGGLEFAPNAAMASKQDQITVAKRIAFTGYKGAAPQGLSAWEVVTQGKVPGVTGSMTAADFGGIQNLDVSRPMQPGDPGYIPTTPQEIWNRAGTSAASGPGTIAGIPMPGLGGQAANIADILNATSTKGQGTYYSQGTPTGLMTPEELERLRTTGGGEPLGGTGFWGKVQSFIQSPTGPVPDWLKEVLKPRTIQVLPNLPENMGGQHRIEMDSGLGRNAANQNLHRGISGPLGTPNGPKGTKEDPIVTTDPKVAENTDPSNQPGAPDGPPLTAPDAGGGIGGSAGKGGIAGYDANGNPVDANGNPMGDLAGGLGDVASKAFSDQFAGTPFSDPTQWPNVQSAGALLQFFGGLLRGDGSGLGGLFGGPGGKRKGPSDKQLRDSGQAVTRRQQRADELKAKLDAMEGKPQYTAEDRAAALQDWKDAQQEADDAKADDTSLRGSVAQPFGQFNLGSPPPSPGGDTNGGAVTPGGGWAGASLPTGLIPEPGQVAPAAPPAGGPQVNVDLSTTQQIQGDPAQARDMAARATNTNNAAAVQTIKNIPGVQ